MDRTIKRLTRHTTISPMIPTTAILAMIPEVISS